MLLNIISWSQNSDVENAKALVKRIAPIYANQVVFQQKPNLDTKDYYELKWENNQLVITANNANSMAVGFNNYLEKYCHVSVSWYVNDKIILPKKMPKIPVTESTVARVKNRFFLNYCTFGYTMTWWQWRDWEHFIDWMALNGVNLPLAITGQEKVWLNVWQKFGLSENEIRAFFTGPAYLPWHRMSNIDHWEGPLPMSWIDNQADLQKKIVERERAFNMKPVLPAFAGHVPKALQKYNPELKITSLGSWGDFDNQYESYFLDSFDPLFYKIQKAYLEEQTKLFGTDHIYGIDPFNEVTPPSWEPQYLADVSKNIYQSLTQVDSQAQWLQMTWIFFIAQDQWTSPRMEAFLKAVPQDKMILLDYFCEHTEVWKKTDSYYGQPYLWCYLGNFGGNTMLEGNLQDIDQKVENVMAKGGDNFWGLGATLEGFGNNRMVFQYVLDKAWHNTNYKKYTNQYALCVSGKPDENIEKAWNIMSETIYKGISDTGHGDLTNSKPVFEKNYAWTVRQEKYYDNKDLLKVWQLLLQSNSKTDTYYFDLVNVGKQVMGNYFPVIRDRFTKAYNEKNIVDMEIYSDQMLELMYDIDTLLATEKNSLLGKWLHDAQAFGINDIEKEYYATDARRIITTWGGKDRGLNDYANRSIAGLMKDFYAIRWKIFIDDAIASVKNGTEFDVKANMEKVNEFAWQWTSKTKDYNPKPIGNTLKISKKLFKKYSNKIE